MTEQPKTCAFCGAEQGAPARCGKDRIRVFSTGQLVLT